MRRCFSASCWALRRRASNSNNSARITAPPPIRPNSTGLVSKSLNAWSSDAAGAGSTGGCAGAVSAAGGAGVAGAAGAGVGLGVSSAEMTGAVAMAPAGAAGAASGAAAPPASSLANWLFFNSISRCNLSIWLCRSVMRLFNSALSRRVVSRLSWVTASLLPMALASPAGPLPLALPVSAETRLRLSLADCAGAPSRRPRLVASSCCWPVPGLAT
ncbi:hypothetical protein D3C73_867720 [compost metagenome]